MYGCNQPFIPGLMTDTVYSVLRNYCTKKSADTVLSSVLYVKSQCCRAGTCSEYSKAGAEI